MATEAPVKDTEVFHALGEPVGTVEGTSAVRGEQVLMVARSEEMGGGIVVVPLRQVDVGKGVTLPLDADGVAQLPRYLTPVPLDRYLDYWRRFTYSADASDPSSSTLSPEERALILEQVRRRQQRESRPEPTRRDADIAADVRELLAADERVNPRTLKVEVLSGVVILEGEKNDLAMRQAAEECAFQLSDVKDVVNMIVVNASI